VRDRRWDFLYDRQKQPVKIYILERYAIELAEELSTWPPPSVEWVTEELRARYAGSAAEKPRDDVLRFALELARLDLLREHEELAALFARDAHRLHTPTERATAQLLVLLVTERCLELKEHAEGARLTRDDLAGMVADVERRLFRVTLS
jgi:hypothetical protein